jgi:hypothetical protein
MCFICIIIEKNINNISCRFSKAATSSSYPGNSVDGFRTADLTELAAESTATDPTDSNSQKSSCVLVFGIPEIFFF